MPTHDDDEEEKSLFQIKSFAFCPSLSRFRNRNVVQCVPNNA